MPRLRDLWLYSLPLLFLPNMGLGRPTAYGTFELSDFLIVPYVVLLAATVFLGRRRLRGLLIGRLRLLLLSFVVWALISTLTIEVRFGYYSSREVNFGLLKLAKFGLYAGTGVLTTLALARRGAYAKFRWALLGVGAVVGAGLVLTPTASTDTLEGYKANNAVSVLIAMLICFVLAELAGKRPSPTWRAAAKASLGVMLLGLFLSEGRGGWVACLAGVGYLCWRHGLGKRAAFVGAFVGGAIFLGYTFLPAFKDLADRTLFPDPVYLKRYHAGVGGIDDGARLHLWADEGVKVFAHPVLGTGFFHRGGRSGLRPIGSHSFWIQMFLETGLVGGALIVGALLRMWRHAGSALASQAARKIPVQAALCAGIVGSLGGEYFYGGVPLLGLVLLYGPVGCLLVHGTRPPSREGAGIGSARLPPSAPWPGPRGGAPA